MKLQEIAMSIQDYLQKFEADRNINAPSPVYKTRPYYCSRSWSGGNRVFVRFISYQGQVSLTKQEALDYLAWLDAGNIGKYCRFIGQRKKEQA